MSRAHPLGFAFPLLQHSGPTSSSQVSKKLKTETLSSVLVQKPVVKCRSVSFWTVEKYELNVITYGQQGYTFYSPLFKTWLDDQWQAALTVNTATTEISISVYLVSSNRSAEEFLKIEGECRVFDSLSTKVLLAEDIVSRKKCVSEFYPGKFNGMLFCTKTRKDEGKETLNAKQLILEIQISMSFETVCNGTEQVQTGVKSLNERNTFASLWENETLSDFVVNVRGKTFKVHKVVLASASPVFKAMIDLNFQEKSSNELNIVDFEHNIIHMLLWYLYTSEKPKLTVKTAMSLYHACDKYDIPVLRMFCKKFLINEMAQCIFGDDNDEMFKEFLQMPAILHSSADDHMSS